MANMSDPNAIRRKLVIVGDGGCGKTSLLSVFTLGYFPSKYIPTVFENYVTDCRVDGKLVQLALWDTAGQEDYDRLRALAYSNAHVVLIAFSVDDQTSFNNVKEKWYNEVQSECPDVPIILVGLKKDVRDTVVPDFEKHDHRPPQTFIREEDGISMMKEIQAKKYIECSALNGLGVDDVFEASTRAALVGVRPRTRGCCSLM